MSTPRRERKVGPQTTLWFWRLTTNLGPTTVFRMTSGRHLASVMAAMVSRQRFLYSSVPRASWNPPGVGRG